MARFRVAIEEIIVQEFEIEAADENEALKKAVAGYKSGEMVLENPEVQHRQLAVLQDESSTVWIEF